MRKKTKQHGFTLLEIMLVVSIIVIILGVAISKLGNTTGVAKSMRVQADVQAIKTQLQLYESMPNRRMIRDLPAGISCSRSSQKIPGAAIIFIAILVSKIRAATIYIPQGRIGRLTQRMTIGAAVDRSDHGVP